MTHIGFVFWRNFPLPPNYVFLSILVDDFTIFCKYVFNLTPKIRPELMIFFLSSNFLKQYQLFADDATMHPTLRGIKTLGDHMSMIRPNRAKSMMMLDSTYIDGLDEVKKIQMFLFSFFWNCFFIAFLFLFYFFAWAQFCVLNS